MDTDQAKNEAREVLVFRLGQEEYGIDITVVQELRGYDKVTAIANSPDFIKGVINLRGIIVPIIDLRIKFRLGNPSYDQFTVVVVMNINQHTIGMVVDSVSDVVLLAPDHIKPAPQMSSLISTDYVTGLGMVEDRMIILADVHQLALLENAPLPETAEI